MPDTLGKRKRRSAVGDAEYEQAESIKTGDAERLQALLKQHFEDQFEPLQGTNPLQAVPLEGEDDLTDTDSESDWEGLSEDARPQPELVYHATAKTPRPDMSKAELKTFMV